MNLASLATLAQDARCGELREIMRKLVRAQVAAFTDVLYDKIRVQDSVSIAAKVLPEKLRTDNFADERRWSLISKFKTYNSKERVQTVLHLLHWRWHSHFALPKVWFAS